MDKSPDAPRPSTSRTRSAAPGSAGTAKPKSTRSRAKSVKAPAAKSSHSQVDGQRRPGPAGRCSRGWAGGSGRHRQDDFVGTGETRTGTRSDRGGGGLLPLQGPLRPPDPADIGTLAADHPVGVRPVLPTPNGCSASSAGLLGWRSTGECSTGVPRCCSNWPTPATAGGGSKAPTVSDLEVMRAQVRRISRVAMPVRTDVYAVGRVSARRGRDARTFR